MCVWCLVFCLWAWVVIYADLSVSKNAHQRRPAHSHTHTSRSPQTSGFLPTDYRTQLVKTFWANYKDQKKKELKSNHLSYISFLQRNRLNSECAPYKHGTKMLWVKSRGQWFWRPYVWHKKEKFRRAMEFEDLFIKNRFPKYWVVASILDFLVRKKYTPTLLWEENFFSLSRSNGVSKNPSFHKFDV